ncbi:CoA-binding protein [Salinigranum marinum]|uniref:CoA-binding protein n=1 Tax=Salinigranum marinum TaxID=1515595 RepID=UPI002989C22B|nr:CoA-binding protein [Salinigranum marinum]
MPVTSDAGLSRLLERDPIAIVGCSRTAGKAAHEIPRYLQRHGYRIVPVNPMADEILGETAYDSLAAVPNEVELVNVFRPSREVSGVVDRVLDRNESRDDAEAIWLQLGIRDDDAAVRAEAGGLDIVQDRCMKVEHARLLG